MNLRKIDPSIIFPLIYLITVWDAFSTSIVMLHNLALNPSAQSDFPVTLSFFYLWGYQQSAIVLLILNLVVPITCLVFYGNRSLRITNFILYFLTKGFVFSFWRTENMYRPLFYTLLFFAICPAVIKARDNDKLTLYSFRGAILGILSFYFFAGLWKVVLGIDNGHIFETDYGAQNVAHYLLSHGKDSLLGAFAIHHPWLSYAGMCTTVIFQLSSIYCLFNEKFLRLWPIGAIAFHILNIFVMNINFMITGLVVTLVFLMAPSEAIIRNRFFSKVPDVK